MELKDRNGNTITKDEIMINRIGKTKASEIKKEKELKEFYTVSETAAMFRVDPETIKKKCQTGKIKAIKISNLWRIPKKEINRMAKKGF